MKIIKNILPLIILLVSFQGCAQNDPSKSLTVKELKDRISSNDTTMVILDVRTDGEIKGSLPIIKDAVHIPIQEIGSRYNELEKYKDKTILVICRTQNRSSNAADFLIAKGYDALCVVGGMTEFYKN